MGSSPKEDQAQQNTQYWTQAANRFASGDLSAMSENSKIDPMYANILKGIHSSFSAEKSNLMNQVGESVVQGGVAPGHNQSNAFLSTMAPAIAGEQQAEGSLGQMRMQILTQLFGDQNKDIISALMGLNQATSGMKGTTATGDTLGAIQTAGTIGGALAGL